MKRMLVTMVRVTAPLLVRFESQGDKDMIGIEVTGREESGAEETTLYALSQEGAQELSRSLREILGQ